MSAGRPGRPMVRVDWVDIGHTLAAYVDGACVATGDRDRAADVVRDYLSRRALTLPGGRVLAEFRHRGRSLGQVVIDGDGTLHPEPVPEPAPAPGEPPAPPTPPAAQPPVPNVPAGRPSADRASVAPTVRDEAAGLLVTLRGHWPAEAAPASHARSGGTAPTPAQAGPRRPSAGGRNGGAARSGHRGTDRETNRRSEGAATLRNQASAARRIHVDRRPLLIVAAALVALLVAGLVWTQLRSRDEVSIGRDETLPVAPPAEWDARSRWRTPTLLPGAGRVLVIDGTAVAFVTAQRRLAVVDATSGDVRWSGAYPEGKPGSDLAVGTVDGRRVIAAHVGDQLAWWDLDTGSRRDLGVPSGATVTLRGATPLIVHPGGRTAGVVRDGRLATVAVPDGATALAARTDGVITATGAAGWWHLRPGEPQARPVPFEHPGPAGTPTIVGYLADSIVTVLPTATSGTAYVAVYADRARDVRFSWGTAAWFDGPAADWYPSPSQRWGILGRTLIDLTSARTTDLGGWTTQLVSADRAMGLLATERVIVGPRIPAGVLARDETFPEDLTESGALVRTSAGDAETVYLLPPRRAT